MYKLYKYAICTIPWLAARLSIMAPNLTYLLQSDAELASCIERQYYYHAVL